MSGRSFMLWLILSSQLLLASSTDNATCTINVNETDHGSMEDECHTEEESFSSKVHIAKVDIERVQTLLIVTMFIMVVVLAKLGMVQFRPIQTTFISVYVLAHSMASQMDASCLLEYPRVVVSNQYFFIMHKWDGSTKLDVLPCVIVLLDACLIVDR